VYILGIALWLLSPFLVYGDAKRRSIAHSGAWAIAVFLLPGIGLLIYALVTGSRFAWGLIASIIIVNILGFAVGAFHRSQGFNTTGAERSKSQNYPTSEPTRTLSEAPSPDSASQLASSEATPQPATTLSAPSYNRIAIGLYPCQSELAGSTVTLEPGGTVQLCAWGIDKDGQRLEGRAFLPSISDPSVAQVQVNSLYNPWIVTITGVSPGNATFGVSVHDWSNNASLSIHVRGPGQP
jgi:hypothetical protein